MRPRERDDGSQNKPQNDALLFISFSGTTAELVNLLPHISPATPVLAITSHADAASCPLLRDRADSILLPAPIHESEEVSFGLCAPTTSTTVAIAVGDMLALALAEELHQESAKSVFQRNHPGGAIGARARTKSIAADTEEIGGARSEERRVGKECPV